MGVTIGRATPLRDDVRVFVRRVVIMAGAVLAMTGIAAAQERVVDQSHLYASTVEGCARLEQHGVEAFTDMNFVTLSFAEGIQTLEWHCPFFSVQGNAGSSALFVTTVCETPGDIYPDTLSIMPMEDGTLSVTSSYEAMMVASGVYEPAGPTVSSGVSTYYRCNLTELPR